MPAQGVPAVRVEYATTRERGDVTTPASVGDIIADWTAPVDACANCPNAEPPRAVIPSARPGRTIASYECTDCGDTWTREHQSN